MTKRSLPILLFVLSTCVAFAFGGNETKLRGLITGRTADALTLNTGDGTQVVTLTDATKVQSPKGLGIRKERMSWTSLIPGLKVSVVAIPGADGKLEAKVVTFSKDDLETASMIQAGLTPTEEKVEANKQDIAANKAATSVNEANIAANKAQIASNQDEVNRRFSELSDYDVKDQAVVYFASGKATISDKDKADLTKLAANAVKLTGYIIEVQGYADSTGNAAANQTLSKDRAYSVVDFLMQDCSVPPRHIVSPGAMGISNPVSSNETAQGRAENRRVEIKVMVNKGLASQGS